MCSSSGSGNSANSETVQKVNAQLKDKPSRGLFDPMINFLEYQRIQQRRQRANGLLDTANTSGGVMK